MCAQQLGKNYEVLPSVMWKVLFSLQAFPETVSTLIWILFNTTQPEVNILYCNEDPEYNETNMNENKNFN